MVTEFRKSLGLDQKGLKRGRHLFQSALLCLIVGGVQLQILGKNHQVYLIILRE